jgi:hypothetical protein
MSSSRLTIAALLVLGLVALCLGAGGAGGNVNGDQIADPGAEVSVTVQDTRGNTLGGVPIMIVDTDGRTVNRQQTSADGTRHVSLPGRAGTYVVIAARPVVDGQEYVENRDSDQGAPAPAGARCPHLIRCVTVTVDARGTLHGPSQNPAQVDFLFTPPADLPAEQPRTAPANRTIPVRFWDVTDGNRAPLSNSQVRILWLDAGQGRTRPVDGPDLTLIGAGAVQIDFIAPAGYQAAGPTRVSVPAEFAGTVDFSARRVVTDDGVTGAEPGSTSAGSTGTPSTPSSATPAPQQPATPPSAEEPGVPQSAPQQPEDELDMPVVPPLPRPPVSIPLVPGG